MEIKIKVKYVIVAILAFIVAFYGIYQLGVSKYHSEADRLSTSLYQSERAIKSYKIRVDSMDEVVYEQDILYVHSQKAINDITGERDRLKAEKIKDVKMIGDLNAKIAVLEKALTPNTPPVIITNCDSVLGEYMLIPQTFSFKDEWSWAKVTVDRNPVISFGVDKMPLHIVIGKKRGGAEVSSISTENPYVTLDKNNVIIVQEDKKWWQKRWPYFIGGTLIGGGLVIWATN